MSLLDDMMQELLSDFVIYQNIEDRPVKGSTTAEIIVWIHEQGAKNLEHFNVWPRRREFEKVAFAQKVKMDLAAKMQAQVEQAQAHAEEIKQKATEAYTLFDRWQKTKSERVQLQIVRKLYRMGFKIRPMAMLIVHDERHTTSYNAGAQHLGLYDLQTDRPVPRPGETNIVEHM